MLLPQRMWGSLLALCLASIMVFAGARSLPGDRRSPSPVKATIGRGSCIKHLCAAIFSAPLYVPVTWHLALFGVAPPRLDVVIEDPRWWRTTPLPARRGHQVA